MKDTPYLAAMTITGILLIATTTYIATTTDAFTPQNTTTPNITITIPRFEPIPEQSINCTLCHEAPENLEKHRSGGRYCRDCHGAELHKLHTSDETVNLTCQRCHIDNATVPRRLPGHSIICDTCHAYPDPLQPSYGNLITIHIKRGYTCDICHIQDIQSLHQRP